jgi:hypothetical protein
MAPLGAAHIRLATSANSQSEDGPAPSAPSPCTHTRVHTHTLTHEHDSHPPDQLPLHEKKALISCSECTETFDVQWTLHASDHPRLTTLRAPPQMVAAHAPNAAGQAKEIIFRDESFNVYVEDWTKRPIAQRASYQVDTARRTPPTAGEDTVCHSHL